MMLQKEQYESKVSRVGIQILVTYTLKKLPCIFMDICGLKNMR